MNMPGTGMIPKGVGAPPPPGMDNRRGKLMCIKVRMLDDSVGVFHLGHKALGQALFDEVCRHLNLLECDYFSLEFTDCYGNRCWLDKDKPILRQITTTHSDARFYFIVKFYTPNPADLSDCGDFSSEDYPDDSYLSSARFVPNQSTDFQKKVMENHMKLIGMSPGESDLALLETARRCDYYGVKLHGAKDVEGTDVSLTVAHMGIRVFHQLQCVSTFSWAKIRKLSFKRRKLLIKLHPESYQYYKETIEFSFESRNECKNFWKKCVEHHAFFRCIEVLQPKKTREGRFFSKGSAFRYHGRTQKQLIDYVREHRKRREPFTRPIKSGFTSSSGDRLSRPALFDLSQPGYATVSERSVNLISAGASSSVAPGAVQMRHANGAYVSTSSGGARILSQSKSQTAAGQPVPGFMRISYFPGELPSGAYAAPNSYSARNHHPHRNSQNYPSSSNAAAVNAERMCLSDMETSDVSRGVGSMNVRHKHLNSRPLKFGSSGKPTAAAGAVAGDSSDLAEASSDTDAVTSVSLPNVLADDLQLVCREFELKCECGPPKSASGDNFLEQQTAPHRDYDNLSEGSYKLSDNELRSVHSNDVSLPAAQINPVYATTFTAKRVGNVIVKKIVSSSHATPSPNTSTDGEDSYRERRKRMEAWHDSAAHRQQQQRRQPGATHPERERHASSAPSSYAEYPIHRKLVPIEIDGPNVDLDQHGKLRSKKTTGAETVAVSSSSSAWPAPPPPPAAASGISLGEPPLRRPVATVSVHPSPLVSSSQTSEAQPLKGIVYTSKGTVLQRPKIIPDSVDEASVPGIENIYSNVDLAHAPQSSHNYMTLTQPQPVPKTYGAVGPLPGKVITKENLVIAPEGYRARKLKPAVPPKPKNLTSSGETAGTSGTVISLGAKSVSSAPEMKSVAHPVVNLQQDTILQSSSAPSKMNDLQRPALISVQSEDHPEIQKCHLFNSDIPYVLTMRNISKVDESAVEATSSFTTFKDTGNKNTMSEVLAGAVEASSSSRRSLSRSRSPESFRRRKSLDLVPKKRLPSPCNFSSQDHSLSPTTPESGDVLEYLLRRRSVEKSALAKRGRRGDPRRQTQPVRFNIPPSPESERPQFAAISQPNINGCDAEAVIYEVDGERREESLSISLNNVKPEPTEEEQETTTEVKKEDFKAKTSVSMQEIAESRIVDDFPPPPLPPPPPPVPPVVVVKQTVLTSEAAQPVSETCLQESTETLPYADESASSRASCASKEDTTTTEKTPPTSSSTLRTPTGVLWTDF
ncbi:unnamed protein product [Gongylonema pulchrum]|uniref:FERM domain-containing protein n=1 Tax=Gongylonema pulchrum TaxID=637853 RepID=A0A183CUE7_9BILA|nr:unnamed protein product [Gongylonema pulchrum]